MQNQKLTQEEMTNPRQFTSLIEANTNFISHTGDGGNMCFESKCGTLEKVWLEGLDYNEDCVSLTVPKKWDIIEANKFLANADVEGHMEYMKPLMVIKCKTVEEIIEGFKKIEKLYCK